MLVGVGITMFIAVWIWIIYELCYAPIFDENGYRIDIKKEDIEDDLWDK